MKALIVALTLGLATNAVAGQVAGSNMFDGGNGAGIQLNWCNGKASAGDIALVCIVTAKDRPVVSTAGAIFTELSHITDPTTHDRLTCLTKKVAFSGPVDGMFTWSGSAVDWAAESVCYQGGTQLTAIATRQPSFDAFVDASGKKLPDQIYMQPFLLGITDTQNVKTFGSGSVNYMALQVSQSP